MYSYSNLLLMLSERNLTRTALTTELGISSRTVAKIGRGEKIADSVLKKIADFLGSVDLFQIMSCYKRSATRKAFICQAGFTMSFRYA